MSPAVYVTCLIVVAFLIGIVANAALGLTGALIAIAVCGACAVGWALWTERGQ